MKKLTTKQILEIETRLIQQYDLNFQAFRDEVVDHIACEIEEYLEQGVEYTQGKQHVLGKWHFELKPVLGKQGIPTCIVKQLYRKDAVFYLVFFLLFLMSWLLGSLPVMEFTPTPWVSFGCILLGFLISVVVQKRFFRQKSYEMKFYMHVLGSVMLVNIISLTVAMFHLRKDIAQDVLLTPYHLFVVAVHLLILNVFFASQVMQQYRKVKTQSI